MTLNLGSGFTAYVHLATTNNDPDQPPRWLCLDAGDGMRKGATLNTWTSDPTKVNCPACIEWMHA